MSDSTTNSNSDVILNHLRSLDDRISRIENHLHLESSREQDAYEKKEITPTQETEKSERLEFQIGQYWLTKVGIIVLAIGIVLLLTFPYQTLPPIIPSLFGYILVIGILSLSYYWRESFSYLSGYLLGGGLLLFYFTTLRLSFFSVQPVITSRALEVILLILVVGFSFIVSIRKKSIYLISVSLTLGYVAALVSDSAYSIFIIVLVLSALTVYLTFKPGWRNLLVYSIVLTYLTHFLWFINNPFLGNKLQVITSPYSNLIFLLLYTLVFALGNLYRRKEIPEDNTILITTFLNSVASYGLYSVLTFTTFNMYFGFLHVGASLFFLSLSIIFWIREKSKYSTFFYAILGYMALSVGIIVQFKMPDAAIWLCLQSLLVISTAIWFRSKFIVVANFVIYLMVLISYLVTASQVSVVSLSYGVVALLSARIMNWQKDRLELNTEMMRNAYLLTALCAIPYSLYHIIPGEYVALSWVVVAIIYYLSGRIMQIKKYRWMALATLLFTVLYVFFIGVTKFEPTYRIISFIVLGLVLLIISLVYFKMSKKPSQSEKRENDNTPTKK